MKPELKLVIDKYGQSPQFLAAPLVDVNQPGTSGDTLLHLAAASDAVEDIKVLVKGGAHVNAKDEFGDTALHQAAIRGRTKAVRKLLQLGADRAIKNDFGETALDQAELMGRNKIVRILKTHRKGPRAIVILLNS